MRASFSLRIGENRAENNAGVLTHTFGQDLPQEVREAEAEVKECGQKLVQLERILAEPFTYDAEIQEIETRLLQLDLEIKAELGDVESEERQAARVDLDAPEEPDEGDEDVEVEFD